MAKPPEDQPAKTAEYECLRTELISLEETALRIWRMGLVALTTLLGVIVVQVVAVWSEEDFKKLSENHEEILILLLIFLYAVGMTIARFQVVTIHKLEKAKVRLGAFLAVFHDTSICPQRFHRLGWHVWNRIEIAKAALDDVQQKYNKSVQEPDLPQYIEENVRVYVIALLIYIVVLASLAAVVVENPWTLSFAPFVIVGGLAVIGWFWQWVRKKQVEARAQSIIWTRKWTKLANQAQKGTLFTGLETEEFFMEVKRTIDRDSPDGSS